MSEAQDLLAAVPEPVATTHEEERLVRDAIEGRALRVALQPVADLRDGTVIGFEAFARFATEPQRAPSAWFRAAEAVGLRKELECAAIRRALAYLPLFPAGTFLAVSASPATVMSAELRALLVEAVAGRLVIEVTDHGDLHDYEALGEALGELRARGARLALDDTGAGLASLRRIASLEPDFIKLHRQLTRDIDRDPTGRALAWTLVTLAVRIGARVVAEGIETAAELNALVSSGVLLGQGYLLSRPQVPVDERLDLPEGLTLPGVGAPVPPSARIAAVREGRARGFRDGVRAAVRALAEELPDCSVVVEQLDHSARVARTIDAVVRGAPVERGTTVPIDDAPAYHMAAGRGPRICNDVELDPTYAALSGCARLAIRSYAGVPLATRDGRTVGAVNAVSSDVDRFTGAHLAMLEDVAAFVGELLEREVEAGERWRIAAVLRDHACRDELTGLLNAESFVDAADRHRHRPGAERAGRYVVVVEIADLARVAHRHGLAVRDLLLKDVAAALAAAASDSYVTGRVGEDRFAVVLYPCEGKEVAAFFCSRVSATLEELARKRDVGTEVRAGIRRLVRGEELVPALQLARADSFRLT